MEIVIVTMTTLLVFIVLSLVFVLINFITSQKFRVKYLVLKEKLYYFGILYYADIVILVGGGISGFLIYKLSQGE